MDLTTPVEKIPTIGTIYQRKLEKLGIFTVEDFITHFPFRYEDYTLISKIGRLQEGETVTIQGTVDSIKNEFTRGRRFIQKAIVSDPTGTIDVVWFNQPYLTRVLNAGSTVSLAGKVDAYRGKSALVSPIFELINADNANETIHTARLVPVYPETNGVSSKWLRAKIRNLLTVTKHAQKEYLPKQIMQKYNLVPYDVALEQIHFPKNLSYAEKARDRLAFDELLLMQIQGLLRKKEWEQKRKGIPFSIARFKREISQFWESLPFTLTNAQERAVKDIFADLTKPKPMNRLLEGDVGSGKTVVAAISMYIAFLNGYQSVLMAPTEILTNQHFDTISKLLTPLGVRVGLITGSKKPRIMNKESGIRKDHDSSFILPDSYFDILIGTHALLSESVKLTKLALIVIDEQHRFGVQQRGLLLKKSGKKITPHVLTMTATPIPRTVALTMYGNLDLSYLDQMPKGRMPVKTWVVRSQKRDAAYAWVKEKIKGDGAQVFIVCPFIEESESMITVRAATKEYERLQKDIFRNARLGLLHGKMKTKEKEKIIHSFRVGDCDILVATPVVEVGIDIPGATIIIIEGSERFGLAALHQLRGRVGRREIQSYCLLFTDSESKQSIERLLSLERIHVGAALAELDLSLRGPGEVHGTKQHGLPMLKIASFSDLSLIQKTKHEAELLVSGNSLSNAPLLKEKLKTYTIQAIEPN